MLTYLKTESCGCCATAATCDLIIGIRPGHFEDAAWSTAGGPRASPSRRRWRCWSRWDRQVRLLPPRRPPATAQELEELAADAGAGDAPGGSDQVVARLDPASRAREGRQLELWFDPGKLHLFNPENGAHLTL